MQLIDPSGEWVGVSGVGPRRQCSRAIEGRTPWQRGVTGSAAAAAGMERPRATGGLPQRRADLGDHCSPRRPRPGDGDTTTDDLDLATAAPPAMVSTVDDAGAPDAQSRRSAARRRAGCIRAEVPISRCLYRSTADRELGGSTVRRGRPIVPPAGSPQVAKSGWSCARSRRSTSHSHATPGRRCAPNSWPSSCMAIA
jgi:hypothetical protein